MTKNELLGNSEQLKNCPFCGSEGFFLEHDAGFNIVCSYELCGTSSATKEEAIKAWNTRIIPLGRNMSATEIQQRWDLLATDEKLEKLLAFLKKTVRYQTDTYFLYEPETVQEHLDEAEKLLKEVGE